MKRRSHSRRFVSRTLPWALVIVSGACSLIIDTSASNSHQPTGGGEHQNAGDGGDAGADAAEGGTGTQSPTGMAGHGHGGGFSGAGGTDGNAGASGADTLDTGGSGGNTDPAEAGAHTGGNAQGGALTRGGASGAGGRTEGGSSGTGGTAGAVAGGPSGTGGVAGAGAAGGTSGMGTAGAIATGGASCGTEFPGVTNELESDWALRGDTSTGASQMPATWIIPTDSFTGQQCLCANGHVAPTSGLANYAFAQLGEPAGPKIGASITVKLAGAEPGFQVFVRVADVPSYCHYLTDAETANPSMSVVSVTIPVRDFHQGGSCEGDELNSTQPINAVGVQVGSNRDNPEDFDFCILKVDIQN